MSSPTPSLSWPRLLLGALVTLALALSVHAVMIQRLHVPYPSNFPRTGWPLVPDATLAILATIFLARHLPPSLRERSVLLRAAVLFLLLAAMRERLIRHPFMEFINLSNLTLYPFLDNLPALVSIAFTALIVALHTTRRRPHPALSLLLAVALACFNTFLLAPSLARVFGPLLQFTSAREGVQRYGLPYDWHILLPAYLTFLEPVAAALVIAFLVRAQLPPAHRFALTALLVTAFKGPVFAPFLNIHFAPLPPLLAFLSYAQFSFETIALGLLTALTVAFSLRREDRP